MSDEEKNCGTCADKTCGLSMDRAREKGYPCWQPQDAEPQGWEQRLLALQKTGAFPGMVYEDVEDFIRAEIERVREEEKRAILRFLGDKLGALPFTQEAIEQNKHREGR